MNGIQHLTTPTCLKFCLGIMLFIWPQLLKIWPQLSPVWPQLLSFGERDGDNFFTARANPGMLHAYTKRQIFRVVQIETRASQSGAYTPEGACQ